MLHRLNILLVLAGFVIGSPCFSTLEPGSLGLCAEFLYPPEGIVSACSDQYIRAWIGCCDTSLGVADTIHITSTDTTTEWFDSSTSTWEPVVALDPTPWGDYWVHLNTDTCNFVWSTYPATGSHGDWFRVLVESECSEIDSAFIRIQVDNKGTIYANGEYIDTTHGNPGSGSTGWRQLFEFDLTEQFHGGVDTVTIMGYNSGGIAGMLFEIYVYCVGGCCGNIDPSTIAMEVNGNIYHTTDPELTWDSDSILEFIPQPPDTFTDGMTVDARLLYAEDSCGWGFDSSMFNVDLSFNIDLSPPTYELISPTEVVLEEMAAGFTFTIEDLYTSVNPVSIYYEIGDGPVSATAIWDGTYLSIDPAIAGILWSPGDSIHICISAEDTPDLCPPNGSSTCWAWYMRDPDAPVPSFRHPTPMLWTACVPESVVVSIVDPFGIDSITIELDVNGDLLHLPHPTLRWAEPVLTYTDPTGFDGIETVTIRLTHAEDLFGNDIDAPISLTFRVDHTPPISEFRQPDQPMVRDIQQDIAFWTTDLESGINTDLCRLVVNGVSYPSSELLVAEIDDGYLLTFQPENHGVTFINGDTVSVCIRAGDSPDRCAANTHENCASFTIEPVIGCGIAPNPFTPNGDDINDRALFYYPDLFSETVQIKVFDRRRTLIWESEAPPQRAVLSTEGRLWNGMDNNGKECQPGLYLYIVTSGGEVVCNGTIVLVR